MENETQSIGSKCKLFSLKIKYNFSFHMPIIFHVLFNYYLKKKIMKIFSMNMKFGLMIFVLVWWRIYKLTHYKFSSAITSNSFKSLSGGHFHHFPINFHRCSLLHVIIICNVITEWNCKSFSRSFVSFKLNWISIDAKTIQINKRDIEPRRKCRSIYRSGNLIFI